MMVVDAFVSLIAGEETAPVHEEALSAWEATIILSRPGQLNCRYSQAESIIVEWLDARSIALRETTSAREVLSHAVAIAEDTASVNGR